MTNQQKEFLYLCLVEQLDYKAISVKLDIPRYTLSIWYDELKEERMKIAAIRNLWTRKKLTIPFDNFYHWYLLQEKRCIYCGITEQEIKQLLDSGKLKTKRIATRGKKLELDRKEPDSTYDDLNNLVFACYWCNNAKTDTFTSEEFIEVGKVFKNIWTKRLEK